MAQVVLAGVIFSMKHQILYIVCALLVSVGITIIIATALSATAVWSVEGERSKTYYDASVDLGWGRDIGIGIIDDVAFCVEREHQHGMNHRGLPRGLRLAVTNAADRGYQFNRVFVRRTGAPFPWLGRASIWYDADIVAETWVAHVPTMHGTVGVGIQVFWGAFLSSTAVCFIAVCVVMYGCRFVRGHRL